MSFLNLHRDELFYPDITKHKNYLVSVKQLTGIVGMHAVWFSPYKVPDKLEEALTQLYDRFFSIAKSDPRTPAPDNEFSFFHVEDVNQLRKVILNRLTAIPECLAWNQRKNSNPQEFQFTSRFDGPRNPDDDFIDLHALASQSAMVYTQHSIIDSKHVLDEPTIEDVLTPSKWKLFCARIRKGKAA